MKLTGDLKKRVEKAETREAARETIADAGMLLNDDELDQVAGGGFVPPQRKKVNPPSNIDQEGKFGDPQCGCSGENINMIAIGTDSTGRITYYQCPLCGATKNIYW